MPPFVLHTVYDRQLFDRMQNAQGTNPYLAAKPETTDRDNQKAPFSMQQDQCWANVSRMATMIMIKRHAASTHEAHSAIAVVQLLAKLHNASASANVLKDANVALRIADEFALPRNAQCAIVRYSDTVLVTSLVYL